MKSKLIIATVALTLLARVHAGQITESWDQWRGEFNYIAQSAGLSSGDVCTSYAVGGETHLDRLLAYYRVGLTPRQAFDEMGCDAEVFELVWMERLRDLAQQRHIKVPPKDDSEGFEEWLWLEYFTEGTLPEYAINAVECSGYSP